MSNFLSSILLRREPGLSIAPVALAHFGVADPTLSGDVVVDGDAWLVDSSEPQVVRLFEVPDPEISQGLLFYRASLKSEQLSGRAYLEMWCRLPGRGEFFSRGLNQTLSGTTAWSSFEVPFRLKKGQRPDLVKLNLVVEGRGKVWIRDVELLRMSR
jgi:hypothetical protein